MEKIPDTLASHLQPWALALCEEGLRRMATTKDILHDLHHVERILNTLVVLLKEEPQLADQLNYNVLLPAICWHDSWKATRFPSRLHTLLFDQYWDGYGSMFLFQKYAKQKAVPSTYRRKIAYVIREHGRLHIFGKPQGKEIQVLRELDALDEWSLDRLEPAKKIYLKQAEKHIHMLKLAKFYFDHFMAKANDQLYRFTWTKAEFHRRHTLYLQETNRLLEQYGHLFSA